MTRMFPVLAALICWPLASVAQTPDPIAIVTQLQDATCGRMQTSGSASSASVSANAKAEIAKVLRKLATLGAEIDIDAKTDSYVNVTRDELGKQISQERDCRQTVLALVYPDARLWVQQMAAAPASSMSITGDGNVQINGTGNSVTRASE